MLRIKKLGRKMLEQGHAQQLKEAVEENLRKTKANDPEMFLLCGMANMELGYLIIAE